MKHAIIVAIFVACACAFARNGVEIGSKSNHDNVILKQHQVIQSFKASLNTISEVKIWVRSQETTTLTLTLQKSLQGNILGTSTTQLNSENSVLFIFSSPISVTQENTYFISISSNNNETLCLVDSKGTYKDGSLWIDGKPTPYDLLMEIYGSTPEDSHSKRNLDVDVFYSRPSSFGLYLQTNTEQGFSQSFVTRATQITRIDVAVQAISPSILEVSLRDFYLQTKLGNFTHNLTSSGDIIILSTTFNTSVNVTPQETYQISLVLKQGHLFLPTITISDDVDYPYGIVYRFNTTSNKLGSRYPYEDMQFGVYGTIAPNLPCGNQLLSYKPGGSESRFPNVRMTILKPRRDLALCSLDLVGQEIFTPNGTFEFAVYESDDTFGNETFHRLSHVTRNLSEGNRIFRNVSMNLLLHSDRYYLMGYKIENFEQLYESTFLTEKIQNSDIEILDSFSKDTLVFHQSIDIASLQFHSYGPQLQFILQNVVTTGIISTASITSGSVSTGQTTGGITTGYITSGDITTGDITTGYITSGDITSGEITSGLTSGELTSLSITSGEVTSEAITSGYQISTTGEDNEQNSDNSNAKIVGAIGGTLAGIVVIAFAVVIVFLYVRRKKPTTELPMVEVKVAPEPYKKQITLDELPNSIPVLKDIIVGRRLGGGNFGDVFLGDWSGTNVALKKLKNKEQIEEFVKEAGTLSQVVHPNCVQFLGMFTSNSGEQYLVTEYLSKGSLKAAIEIRKKALTFLDLLIMCLEAAKGLAYLESKNIVHRDIALRNLLVTKIDGKYVTKVSDFGLSRTTKGGIYAMSVETRLPIKWTAPEVLRGAPATIKNDVWSFGVTMWEIFSFGKEPFGWLSNKEAFMAVSNGDRLAKPDICTIEVYEIMLKCWNANQEDRPSFSELVSQLVVIKRATKSELGASSPNANMKPHLGTSGPYNLKADNYEMIEGIYHKSPNESQKNTNDST